MTCDVRAVLSCDLFQIFFPLIGKGQRPTWNPPKLIKKKTIKSTQFKDLFQNTFLEIGVVDYPSSLQQVQSHRHGPVIFWGTLKLCTAQHWTGASANPGLKVQVEMEKTEEGGVLQTWLELRLPNTKHSKSPFQDITPVHRKKLMRTLPKLVSISSHVKEEEEPRMHFRLFIILPFSLTKATESGAGESESESDSVSSSH